MTATARRIGKSKSECITVDGKVFIKSCLIGKWSHLVITESKERNTIESKHSDEHLAKESMILAKESYRKYLAEDGRVMNCKFSVIKIKRG